MKTLSQNLVNLNRNPFLLVLYSVQFEDSTRRSTFFRESDPFILNRVPSRLVEQPPWRCGPQGSPGLSLPVSQSVETLGGDGAMKGEALF